MSTYKVLQDIETEDKLVGPLTFRQFIYAIIVVVLAFIAFKMATLNLFLAIPFLPFILLLGLLSAPFGHDQSNEVWLLAKIRFMLKPHLRIWNQSGTINLVTITVPKQISRLVTKDMSEDEVSSRLESLAKTIDSRGWAIKNVNVNLSPSIDNELEMESDRLIDPSSFAKEVPSYDISPSDDIFDTNSNTTAQKINQMSNESDRQHIKQAQAVLTEDKSKAKPAQSNQQYDWFLNQPAKPEDAPKGYTTFHNSSVIKAGEEDVGAPNPDQHDLAILNEIRVKKSKEIPAYGHMRVIDPNGSVAEPNKPAQLKDKEQVTDPDILKLALANKDNWTVATTQHMAQKAQKKEPPIEPPQDEVVITLHN